MNIFTKDDYRKIQAWLKANAIKDSDFTSVDDTIPEEDTLILVQKINGILSNVKISIKNLFNSTLSKVIIDTIIANAVKVNNTLIVTASNVKIDNEKGTTLQDIIDWAETIENTAKGWKIEHQVPSIDEPTVRAKYVLKDSKGVPKGDIIKVYKDSAVTNVYLGTTEDICNENTGEVTKKPIQNNNEALSIVYRLDTGKYSLVNVPIGIFIREAEFDKYRGLGITENGQVFIKLANDVESSNYLHFNDSGELSADGIENRILQDLGTIINSVAGDGTMWGQYKKEEGTKESPTNEASRWGQYKQAEADRNERLNNLENKIEEEKTAIIDTNRIANGAVTIPKLSADIQALIANLSKNYVFAGIATPTTNPGTPDGPVFYIATEVGTYSNFDGISIADGEAVILEWKDSWTKKTTGFAIQQQITKLDETDKEIKKELSERIDALEELDIERKQITNAEEAFIIQDENTQDEYLHVSKNGLKCKDIIITKDGENYSLPDTIKAEITRAKAAEEVNAQAIETVFQSTDNRLNTIEELGIEREQTVNEEEAFIIQNETTKEEYLHVNKNGVRCKDIIINKDGENYSLSNAIETVVSANTWKGKNVVGIGDSLSQNGYYEKDFCEKTGAIYKGVFSAGGTMTPPNGGTSTQDRVKKFVESGTKADLIFIENVNDSWFAYDSLGEEPMVRGSISDDAFMISQYVTVETSAYTSADAFNYFDSNFTQLVNGISTKQKGTIMRMKWTSKRWTLTVNDTTVTSGTIIITTNDNTNTVTITDGMTSNEIASAIYQYAYNGYSKSLSGNVVKLTALNETSSAPVVDTGNTGVDISISENISEAYADMYFTKTSEAEFTVKENWGKSGTLTLYSYYKGIIEYLQENKPEATLVFVMPSTWILNYSDMTKDLPFRNSDGTYNMYKVMNGNVNTYIHQRFELLRKIQTEVVKFYGIKYVNCHENCGISPFNIATYYNSGDIHPKRLTYTKWAQEIIKNI